MVMTIVLRAREGDHRMPACSPAESSCAPFWSLLDGQEVDGYGVAELIGRLGVKGDCGSDQRWETGYGDGEYRVSRA
jgi:hypothetical protein